MMTDLDPRTELRIRELLEEHRKDANNRYAIKLVERVVFYFVGAMGIAVLAAMLRLVII